MLSSNRELFNLLKHPSDPQNYIILREEILRTISPANVSQSNILLLENKLKSFCGHLKKKWVECNYRKEFFLKKNESWLNRDFQYPDGYVQLPEEINVALKPFGELSERHKMRRVEELRASYSGEELLFAAKMNLRQEGHSIKAKIVSKLLDYSDDSEELTKMSEAGEKSDVISFSSEKTLALSTSLNLSKSQYFILRDATLKAGSKLFPSYYQLSKAKKECYPKECEVTELGAKIPLQALLNHTTSRILSITSMGESLTNEKNLKLISKWGCDGSSSHSVYKQPFSSNRGITEDDSALYLTTLVPIRLIDTDNSSIVWENLRPSSIHFCRPVKFVFCKETPETIKLENERMESEIASLIPTQINQVKVEHELYMTMIDGKTINVVTDTSSSMRCYVCGATPTMMNNLKQIDTRTPNAEHYRFGISPFHAKIRFLECLLHISYNLDFKKWSANTDLYKNQRRERKIKLQKQFKDELGLHIDRVKQGAGTYNDGNMARMFFSDPKTTAKITGVNEEVIRRFAVILQAISSGKPVCPKTFGLLARETAEIYVKHYGWYHMPPTVHKVLIHGEKIIESFILPIGKFSEEAQEALNKVFRHCRDFRARKMLRQSTNEDILNNLLVSSDPRISALRPHCSFKNSMGKKLFPETQTLLLVADDVHEEDDLSSDFLDVSLRMDEVKEEDSLLDCIDPEFLEETVTMMEVN